MAGIQDVQHVGSATAECSTSVHLLLDMSHTMEGLPWHIQLSAHAAAIEDPETVKIIQSVGGVALKTTFFGVTSDEVMDWRVIRTQEDATRFADELRQFANYGTHQLTKVGLSAERALDAFSSTPCQPEHLVLDVSTDAFDINYSAMNKARDAAETQGIKINSIGVVNDTLPGADKIAEMMRSTLENNLQTYDGFTRVTGWNDYADIFRQKFQAEIVASYSPESLGDLPAPSILIAAPHAIHTR